MRIGYFSDLHVEFMKPEERITQRQSDREMSRDIFALKLGESYSTVDIVVAAGDIADGVDAVRFLKQAFHNKPTIFVPGNHEHYGHELHSNNADMANEAAGSNVYFFHDGATLEFGGVIFCGATLWTDYSLRESRVSRYYAMKDAQKLSNDYRRIRINPSLPMDTSSANEPKRIRPRDILALHEQHKENIKKAMRLAKEANRKLVVVSHHAPCAQSLQRGTAYHPVDVTYASHLDDLLEGEDAPNLWVHGHVHTAVDYNVGHTRILNNPKGSKARWKTGWEWGKYVTLDPYLSAQKPALKGG